MTPPTASIDCFPFFFLLGFSSPESNLGQVYWTRLLRNSILLNTVAQLLGWPHPETFVIRTLSDAYILDQILKDGVYL